MTSAYLEERFDREIMSEMGALGLLGATIAPEYGGAGLNYVSYGLIARAVERVDSGYRSAMSVQSILVMYPIHAYGIGGAAAEISAEARHRRMGRLLRPDRARRRLRPRRDAHPGEKIDGGYRLTGTKMWITNSPIADVFVVWAKSDAHDGEIRGFVLEKGMAGLSRAEDRGEAVAARLDHRRDRDGRRRGRRRRICCPTSAGLQGPVRLPQPRPLRHRLGLDGRGRGLLSMRRGSYTLDRKQFGRPLAATQLVQLKLANMVTEITLGLQAALRVGRRLDEGELIPETISLIKRNNCGKALDIARIARDMHGGNGISAEFQVMRHAANLETVNTYEGTHDVHALILGRAITGHRGVLMDRPRARRQAARRPQGRSSWRGSSPGPGPGSCSPISAPR